MNSYEDVDKAELDREKASLQFRWDETKEIKKEIALEIEDINRRIKELFNTRAEIIKEAKAIKFVIGTD